MAKEKIVSSVGSKKVQSSQPQSILYDKMNFIIGGVGVLVIIIGFLLMLGGKSESYDQFNASEIYSARRITIAPFLVLIGFAVVGYGILRRPAATDTNPPA